MYIPYLLPPYHLQKMTPEIRYYTITPFNKLSKSNEIKSKYLVAKSFAVLCCAMPCLASLCCLYSECKRSVLCCLYSECKRSVLCCLYSECKRSVPRSRGGGVGVQVGSSGCVALRGGGG
jgi:hypothetical protein